MARAAPPLLRLGPFERAAFLERPNRFLVRCRMPGGRVVRAFLPNPGRLDELLFPGSVLFVAPSPPAAGTKERKTRHTVLAVERDGDPVMLHTHLNNRAARVLLERSLVPGLAGARIQRPEVTVGSSRFDFLVRRRGKDLFVEVKSCTLFGNGVAMFPDAVTERGRRHLLELAALADSGLPAAVLFLVHTPRVRWFMPDYHTDLAFARTLLDVRKRIRVIPLSVAWSPRLELLPRVKTLAIPWDHVDREARDRGATLLLMELKRDRVLDLGAPGRVRFPAGHYVHAGWVPEGLDALLARFGRRTRAAHGPVDVLRAAAHRCVALPVRSSRDVTGALARALAKILAPAPARLFFSALPPLDRPEFHALLQRFRMAPPR